MYIMKLVLIALAALALSPLASAYECRIPESSLQSPQAIHDWGKRTNPGFYDRSPKGVLLWDRFGPQALSTLDSEAYATLVRCGKAKGYSQCQNEDRKLARALEKRQFDKLPARPPAGFLQVSADYYGFCFGDRNSEVSLPASLFYSDGLTKRQCDAMLDVSDPSYKSGDTWSDQREDAWRYGYEGIERGKFGAACKYIPTSIVERHRDVLESVRASEADPEHFARIATEKQAAYCHPGVTETLGESAIKSYIRFDTEANKAAAALDPGTAAINADTVRTAFVIYALNNLGTDRFFELLGGHQQRAFNFMRQCFSDETGRPALNCGFPNNVEFYRKANGPVHALKFAKAPLEESFSEELSPETQGFLTANLGSCVLEPGRLKTRAQIAAAEYALTQQPRPTDECWAVAGTIQSFVDNPGFHYSSSGQSYQRQASMSERAWLEQWKEKVQAGNPQCINDYPKRIMAHAKRMEIQRQSAVHANARYMEEQTNRPASVDDVFATWNDMHEDWKECVAVYGDCKWVEE